MTWIYVPSLSAPESEDSSSASDSPSEVEYEPFVMSSGKLTRRPLSWRGWKTRPWIERLYGTISRPSMALRGAESWISSLRDSPASPSARPARSSSSETLDGSGLISSASFARWSRASSSWRTWTLSLDGGSEPFSGRFPNSGSMRNGMCFRRKESEPLTGVVGSTSLRGWPTPISRDWKGRPQRPEEKSSLPVAASMWATPTAGDSKASGSRNAPGSAAHKGTSLTDMIRTGDSHGRRDPETGKDGRSGSVPAVLNPRFVETLMGLPVGWSDCTPLETGSFQSWLRAHSSLLHDALSGDER